MPPLARTALGVVTAPTRLTVELALAAPTVVMALSSLARDTSVLVAELARLSRDAVLATDAARVHPLRSSPGAIG